MASLGVNAVQIPVPCDAFASDGEVVETVTRLLSSASDAGLSAVIVLLPPANGGDVTDEHVKAAAAYASRASSVVALQLPSASASLLSDVRSQDEKLAVLVPAGKGDIGRISLPPDANVFVAFDAGATSAVADVASSNSVDDRMKMFYRELRVIASLLPRPA